MKFELNYEGVTIIVVFGGTIICVTNLLLVSCMQEQTIHMSLGKFYSKADLGLVLEIL